jgi:glycerate kinase
VANDSYRCGAQIPDANMITAPPVDGGEGFALLAMAQGQKWKPSVVMVNQPVEATLGWLWQAADRRGRWRSRQ